MKLFKLPALLLWGIVSVLPITAFARTICVDVNAIASSSPEGSCWKNPYLDLEHALQAARSDKSIKEIWIADGVYRPSKTYTPKDADGNDIVAGAMSLPQYNPGITITGEIKSYDDNSESFNNHLKTFELVDKVDLYGGFQGQSHPNGGEKLLDERNANITLYQTILDGDLDGNPITPDNVWHVMTAGNDITLTGVTTKLDRLVVTNGNAVDVPYYPTNFPLAPGQVPAHYHDDGGGLYVFIQSNIQLNNMLFENNAGDVSGAIHVQDGSTMIITNSKFINNRATTDGGAIGARGGGSNEFIRPNDRVTKLIITNSLFEGNYALAGLAIRTTDNQLNPPQNLSGVDLKITNSIFRNHINENAAGGIILNYGKAELKKVKFVDNALRAAAGIRCERAIISINKSDFINNKSQVGTAVWMSECQGKITNSLFENNSAIVGGAILLFPANKFELVGNNFLGNKAELYGGAIVNDEGSVITNMVLNRFENNQAGIIGGAIMNFVSFGAKIENNVNNIFINNVPDDISNY